MSSWELKCAHFSSVLRITFFLGGTSHLLEKQHIYTFTKKRAFQNSRFAICTLSMGFKRKADPAEVEEIEDEEEAFFRSQFLNHPRWFKVPFSSPSWRSLNPLKGSLNHPKKVTLNHQVPIFLFVRLESGGMFGDMGWCATGSEKTTSAPPSTEGTAMVFGGKMESWRDFVVKKVVLPHLNKRESKWTKV